MCKFTQIIFTVMSVTWHVSIVQMRHFTTFTRSPEVTF